LASTMPSPKKEQPKPVYSDLIKVRAEEEEINKGCVSSPGWHHGVSTRMVRWGLGIQCCSSHCIVSSMFVINLEYND
jgi:hypothetical protein